MEIEVSEYTAADVAKMAEVWNEVVEDGIAFPQTEPLTEETAAKFFAEQTYCGVAKKDSEIVGLYILHPNNIGRCGHSGRAHEQIRACALRKAWFCEARRYTERLSDERRNLRGHNSALYRAIKTARRFAFGGF